jgi:hypothetical protein
MPSLTPYPVQPEGDWVVIANVVGLIEAEIVAGLLRTAAIPCYIHQESISAIYGLAFSAIEVLVPAAYEAEAVALLDAPTLDDSATQIDEPPIGF